MSKFTSFAFVAVALAMGLSSTGCVNRELVRFDDHESKPLTSLNVAVSRNYLFWSTHEYVFYSCTEQGNNLTCKRLCGGDTDLECPNATQSGDSVATNIR